MLRQLQNWPIKTVENRCLSTSVRRAQLEEGLRIGVGCIKVAVAGAIAVTAGISLTKEDSSAVQRW